MAGLFLIALVIVGGFTFVILRLSVSCMFWFSKHPNDKAHVFRTQFPYYIIGLFGLGTTATITFNFEPFLIYYSLCTYVLALLIWNFKLNRRKKTYSTTDKIIEQQNPELP